MARTIQTSPLTRAAFSPFGEVLDIDGPADKMINEGLCGRYHDRAKLDFNDGRAGISLFNAQKRSLPLTLNMMERHPDGSQAFLPMHRNPFLVVVAADDNGAPAKPLAFVTTPGQGINFHRNVWHGVLTPLHDPGLFAVVDRIGDGANLQEHWFDQPWHITDSN